MGRICKVVTRAGVQPATFALGVRCSMQLSYRAIYVHRIQCIAGAGGNIEGIICRS
jgi:hypothetical protein